MRKTSSTPPAWSAAKGAVAARTRCALAAADNVQAGRDNVLRAAALDEVVLHGQHEQPLRGLHMVRVELQRRRNRRYPATAWQRPTCEYRKERAGRPVKTL